MVSKTLDANLIIGKKFNRLTILEYFPRNRIKKEYAKVLCLCDCGNKIKSSIQSVRNGRTRSCGCYNNEIISTHRLSKTPEYRAWSAMKGRCNYEKRSDFHRYGGRGIKVCKRWMNSFENFIADLGMKPSKTHSLDRINNDGNYKPSNCRWATVLEQNRNKTYYQQGQRATLICKFCKNEFSVKKSKEFRSKYCSYKCRYHNVNNQP